MQEVMIKTHLIVKDVHSEYIIKWTGRIIDTKPLFKNGRPVFAVVGSGGRIELNTTDMNQIERCAKIVTVPKGRGAISTDTAYIYIKQEDESEKMLGYLIHNRVKTFAPMYDAVGYRDE